jgi:hypothetical protein
MEFEAYLFCRVKAGSLYKKLIKSSGSTKKVFWLLVGNKFKYILKLREKKLLKDAFLNYANLLVLN